MIVIRFHCAVYNQRKLSMLSVINRFTPGIAGYLSGRAGLVTVDPRFESWSRWAPIVGMSSSHKS